MSQKPLGIIDTRSIFWEITDSLISLLKTLTPEDWNVKTCYPNWKVKNIVVHLFQTGIGRLSKQRDFYPTAEKPKALDFSTLVNLIAQSNEGWSEIFDNKISPKLILDQKTGLIWPGNTQNGGFINNKFEKLLVLHLSLPRNIYLR